MNTTELLLQNALDDWRSVVAKLHLAEARWTRLVTEISCRVGHGADSNGHLEGLLVMIEKIRQDEEPTP